MKSSDQSLVSCSGWAAVGRRGTGLAARGKEALKGLYGVWELSAQHFVFFWGGCLVVFWIVLEPGPGLSKGQGDSPQTGQCGGAGNAPAPILIPIPEAVLGQGKGCSSCLGFPTCGNKYLPFKPSQLPAS